MSEWRKNEAGLVIPKEAPEQGPGEPRIICVYYWSDVEKFQEMSSSAGARIEAILSLPFLNNWGQTVSMQWVIVYQHWEDIQMEILT